MMVAGTKAQAGAVEQGRPNPQATRPVEVADAIRMTRFGERSYLHGLSPLGNVAQFSPDGKKFVVILRKGNLENNTNQYSLLIWQIDALSNWSAPETLVTMSSSSNREAIQNVRWLSDNQTLVFLGENPGELRQLYSFSLATRALKKKTNHPTSVVSYSVSASGDKIAYVAKEPTRSIFDSRTRREGVVVSTYWLPDLIAGRKGGGAFAGGDDELFFQSPTGHTSRVVLSSGIANALGGPCGSPACISPDGKYIVALANVMDFPRNWEEYKDIYVHRNVVEKRALGQKAGLIRYELIETSTGRRRILLNGPVNHWYAEVAWAADSRSVAIGGVFLPLDNTTGEERKARQSKPFSVEVSLTNGEISKVSDEDLKLLGWDAKRNLLSFGAGWSSEKPELGSRVFYEKRKSAWEKVSVGPVNQGRPEIVLEEDLNTPPKMVAVDSQTHQHVMLLDLNPEFKKLAFGRVEQVHWEGSDGHERKGGLYYPVDYVPGRKYPLVLQGHGWTADRFWIDGPWPTAFAAQPLAGKGIFVLQADEEFAADGTPEEVKRESLTFEAAIDYLDGRGMIDRDRVGIIGFSRTCLFVAHLLTHSKYPFAAASITDGIDGGYFQYVAFSNANPGLGTQYETYNGGLPWGEGLKGWADQSASFSLEKVRTPVRLTAVNPSSLLTEWEWFAGLSRMRKPVELVLLEEAEHFLQKPWDRMNSQQGNVDWFCFWLKGEEDPDPAKAEQYARWRELRKLQEANAAGQKPN